MVLASSATRRLIILFVLLGFAATSAAGLGTALGVGGQSLLLYVYLSLLLLALPFVVAPRRSTGQALYTFVGSAFFLVYAGTVAFSGSTSNFTRNPYTYIILEGVLLSGYLVDAVARRFGGQRVTGQEADSSDAVPNQAGARQGDRQGDQAPATKAFDALSVEWAGLALFLFVAAFLLDLLGPQQTLRALGLPTQAQPYVTVDLNAALGLHLPSTLSTLQGLDLALAIGASAVALLLFTLVGDLRITALPTGPTSVPVGPGGPATTPGVFASRPGAYQVAYQTVYPASRPTNGGLGVRVAHLVGDTVDSVLRSVRAVLSPLIWLIPGFSAGALARDVVGAMNQSAQIPGSVLDLFNPLSTVGLQGLGTALGAVALAGLATVAALLAVVVADHSWAAVRNAFALLGGLGRSLPLTLALFLYSLAAFNAAIALFVPTTPLPFRVGALGLLALIAGGSFLAGLATSTPDGGTTRAFKATS
jgi:hypothetical protein